MAVEEIFKITHGSDGVRQKPDKVRQRMVRDAIGRPWTVMVHLRYASSIIIVRHCFRKVRDKQDFPPRARQQKKIEVYAEGPRHIKIKKTKIQRKGKADTSETFRLRTAKDKSK